MKQLDSWVSARQSNAQRYTDLFQAAGLSQQITLPQCLEHDEHVWNQYTIRVLDGQRDTLRAYLNERHVGTEICYPVPLHQQHCFQSLGYLTGSLPETERAAREVLSLPIYPEITKEEQQAVVYLIGRFYEVT